MRISDWSSDVCSSDLDVYGHDGEQELRQHPIVPEQAPRGAQRLDKPNQQRNEDQREDDVPGDKPVRDIGGPHQLSVLAGQAGKGEREENGHRAERADRGRYMRGEHELAEAGRSEEHTSELQSLMRISYAVFCLNKKLNHTRQSNNRI